MHKIQSMLTCNCSTIPTQTDILPASIQQMTIWQNKCLRWNISIAPTKQIKYTCIEIPMKFESHRKKHSMKHMLKQSIKFNHSQTETYKIYLHWNRIILHKAVSKQGNCGYHTSPTVCNHTHYSINFLNLSPINAKLTSLS